MNGISTKLIFNLFKVRPRTIFCHKKRLIFTLPLTAVKQLTGFTTNGKLTIFNLFCHPEFPDNDKYM